MRAVVVEEGVAEAELTTGEDNITAGRTLSMTLGPKNLLPSIVSMNLPASSMETAVVEAAVPALVLFALHSL